MFGQLFLLAETGLSVLTWLLGLAVVVVLLVLGLLCWAIVRRLNESEQKLANLVAAAEDIRKVREDVSQSGGVARDLERQAQRIDAQIKQLTTDQVELLRRLQDLVERLGESPPSGNVDLGPLLRRHRDLSQELQRDVAWVAEKAIEEYRDLAADHRRQRGQELDLLHQLQETLTVLLSWKGQTPEVPLHLAVEAIRQSCQAPSNPSVDCAVFAPEKVTPGESVLVQVFAFNTGAEAEAAALAKEFDSTAIRRGITTLEVALEAGQVLTFHLQLRGAEVSEPVRRMTWRQRTTSVQFVVSVPEDRVPGPLIGTLIVSAEGVPVGRLDFRLTVTNGPAHLAGPVSVGTESGRFRRAFASYASRDRAEVVRRVQMLRRPLTDVEVFQDVLNLEPGEEFAPVLFQRIDECDLFLLFWSNNARESEWVRRELEHALRRQGPEGRPPPTILPVVIEGPPPPAPPPELGHLHFNDYLLYLMR